MNLHSRQFEKALRRRVQQELRNSPALAREHRRERRRFWRDARAPQWAYQLFFGGWLAGMWSALLMEPGLFEPSLAVFALWCLGIVGTQTHRLWATLYRPGDLTVLLNLPLSDADIFARQRREFRRNSPGLLLHFLPAGLVLLVFRHGGGGEGLAAVLLPPLQAVLALATAVQVAAFLPRLGRWLWLGLPAALAAALCAWQFGGCRDALVQAGWWLPPFGWVNYAYERGACQGDLWAWTLLLPAALPVWTLPFAWRRLRERYVFIEPAGFDPDEETDESFADETTASRELGPTELEDRLRAREFLQPLDWTRFGWIERLAARSLSRRERLVAEFMTGGRPYWTRNWQRAVWFFPLSLLLACLADPNHGWLIFIAFVVVAVRGVPLLGGHWRGLESCFIGGQFAPAYAGMPLGFAEMARVMLKASTLRWLAAAPFLLALAAVSGWRMLGDWGAGADMALRGMALCLVLQPAVVALRLAGNGDTQHIKLRDVLIVLLFAAPIMAFTIGALVSPGLVWTTACLGGCAVSALGLMWLYAMAWKRGWFDLAHDRPNNS